MSIFFDKGPQVQSDLNVISGIEDATPARIRILFGPDPDNKFADVGVIVLDFLVQLEKSSVQR